jgi:hypothetical protein
VNRRKQREQRGSGWIEFPCSSHLCGASRRPFHSHTTSCLSVSSVTSC